MSGCGVEGCDLIHYGRGYCFNHYRRWLRSGDPGSSAINTRLADATCGFEGCGEKISCKGLCASHYAQRHRRNQELAPIKRRLRPTSRDDLGRKQCSTCREWKPVADYKRQAKAGDGLCASCRSCAIGRLVAKRYGVDPETYMRISTQQGDGCAICGQTNPSGRGLGVDHDHSCCPGGKSCGKCVRGLLCSSCNMAIGLMGESPQRMHAAIAYLKFYGVTE